MRYGLALIFLILSMSALAFGTTETLQVNRHENVVSINNPQDFISSMGKPSEYIKLKNKQDILAKLDQLIQNPNDPTNQGLIAAYNLLEQTPHLSQQEKSTWIEQNASALPGPFLLLNALYISENEPARAGEWYIFSRLRMSVDAEKCTDLSAREGGLLVLMRLLPKVAANANATTTDNFNAWFKKSFAGGLKLYETTPYKISQPYWIANHGMHALTEQMYGSGKQAKPIFISQSQENNVKTDIIKSMKNQVAKM